MNLTDNEIIKALECCGRIKGQDCDTCPLTELQLSECTAKVATESLDLINRQKAEIERYKHSIKLLEKDVAIAKEDTVKDFAKFIIDKSVKGVIYVSDVVDYVPEFLGR